MAQKLTVEQIFDKEFHVDFKGYNATEVDQFLDMIMQDYEFFQNVMQEQKDLLDRYEETLAQQKRMLLEYEGKSRAASETPSQNVSQLDLLRRVSKLEEAVFKKGY